MKKMMLIVLGMMLLVSLPVFAGGQQEEAAPAAESMAADDGVGPANSNPLSDLRVRQAIAYAIDMDTIAESLFEGMVVVATSRVPDGPWKAPGMNRYEYNPEKSKELLKAANWDPDYVLDLGFYYGDQQTVDLMTAIQAYLSDVGIKMTFRKLEGDIGAQLSTVPADPVNGPSAVEIDLGYGGHAALALQEYYNVYKTGMSAQYPSDPKMDQLIEDINSTADPVELKKRLFAIERYENETLACYPLYYQPLFVYESKDVNRNGGMYGNAQYNYDWGIVNWTVPEDENGKMVLKTNGGPIEFFQNPWENPGIWMSSKVLYDRLIACDGALTPTHGQMADYELSSDGLTLKFTLKDGIKWHDGAPVTVDDVQFSVEKMILVTTGHKILLNTFNSIEGADAFVAGTANHISGITTSGNTITFKMAKLDPNILLTFSQFAILPQKYLADADPLKMLQSPFFQHPVGSGPYRIEKVNMNDYLVMVPFEDYYGGVAKIDEITCYPTFDSDPNVVKNAAAGILDYGFTKNTAEVKALQDMDHMRVTAVDIPYTRILWFYQYPKP